MLRHCVMWAFRWLVVTSVDPPASMNRVDAYRVGDHKKCMIGYQETSSCPLWWVGCVGMLLGVWGNIVPGDHP